MRALLVAVLLSAAPGERAVLLGSEAGSLSKPKMLEVASLADLCRADQPHHEVYSVRTDPGGFALGAYDEEKKTLGIDFDRALLALDGAAQVYVDDRTEAFELDQPTAAALTKRHEEKELSLVVTFRLEADEDEAIPTCFSLKGTEQWTLHVEALTYALVDASGKELAKQRTGSLARLEAWANPGEAKVRIEAHAMDGTLDEEKASEALVAVRPAIESCTAPAATKVADPVALSYVADVEASGKVKTVRPQLVTADLDDVVECVGKTLSSATLLRGSKSYRVSLLVAIDRPGFELLD